ncbi:MAG: hypothetical protein H7210_12280 [Pyrinomonadaceae bacterium]|nr:hypothetical protein [Phycisphaerales bacterium]
MPIPWGVMMLGISLILVIGAVMSAGVLWSMSSQRAIHPVLIILVGVSTILVVAVIFSRRVEGARQRFWAASLGNVFAARGWAYLQDPTWEEVTEVVGPEHARQWRNKQRLPPGFMASGKFDEFSAVFVGPGAAWIYADGGPRFVAVSMLASMSIGVLWVFSDDRTTPGITLTSRIGALKLKRKAGTCSPGKAGFARLLACDHSPGTFLLLAVASAVIGAFAMTVMSARLLGSGLSDGIATVAFACGATYAYRSFKPRKSPLSAEPTQAQGLLPAFDAAFLLTSTTNDAQFWRPTETTQQCLLENGDRILGLQTAENGLAIVFRPGPQSRPGYSVPVSDEAMDQMLEIGALTVRLMMHDATAPL